MLRLNRQKPWFPATGLGCSLVRGYEMQVNKFSGCEKRQPSPDVRLWEGSVSVRYFLNWLAISPSGKSLLQFSNLDMNF